MLMIYTKGKVGHYMGNTDILTTSLPDADTENTTEHSTIFDDVFRTIAQKMPQLLIPLINEVFHTSYSEEEQFEQLRNEHYEKYGLFFALINCAYSVFATVLKAWFADNLSSTSKTKIFSINYTRAACPSRATTAP